MSLPSRSKKLSSFNVAPANRLASRSPASEQQQFPTESQSQSHSQLPQEKQQSQPVCPWSAHAPPSGQSSSPFLRDWHTLSTGATAAGKLYLFGGYVQRSHLPSNDLFIISTRDFSTTLLQTSGDVPSPRYGHRAVLTSTTLLIWGGTSDENAQNSCDDDSLYLLNLVSREWTRIVVNGPGPGGRFYHTLELVGSKLFIFGGRTSQRSVNDIWALDLNSLKSNPFWESYGPAPGILKPLSRSGHVSVTTGDCVIIFGGRGGSHTFNDTWSFNISTRKWTKLQCTGSIPSPRLGHAAVVVGDVMYVFGGLAIDKTHLGDLTALNLSTQRWIAFQDIGPGPSERRAHAMACDGQRIFVLGGLLSRGIQADKAKLIHVLDTQYLDYTEPDSDAVNPSEKSQITQLVPKSSASSSTRGQPHQPSSFSSDANTAHRASPFQKAIREEPDHPTSQQITRWQNRSRNGLPSRPTDVSGRPRRVPEEDDESEGSTGHHTNLVAPDAPPGNEIARLEDGRLIEVERQLSEMLVEKAERDRHIAQLTEQLAQKSALLERAEAEAAETKKHAGLEQREQQAKLGELLAKLDELMLSRGEHACELETELAQVRAELEGKKSELEAVLLRLTDAEDGLAKRKAEADTLRAQTAAGLVNTDMDRVMHGFMERMRAMETEISSLRGNEKSREDMECRNEE